MAHEVVEHLKVADLPVALGWVEAQRAHRELSFYMRKMVDAIMLFAWENLGEPGVREAFVRAALSRLKLHDSIVDERWNPTGFTDMVSADSQKRHLFLETSLPLLERPDQAGQSSRPHGNADGA